MSNKELDYLKSFLDKEVEVKEETQEESPFSQEGKRPIDNTVMNFIKSNNIQSGEFRVPNYVIFMMYRTKFKKVNNALKTNPVSFFRTFRQFFERRRTGQGKFYLINTDFGLTKEEVKLIRKQYQKYYVKKTKQEK